MNKIIKEDINYIINNIDYKKLSNKTVLITGASGMLALYMIFTLLILNKTKKLNIKIVAIARDRKKFYKKLGSYDYNEIIFIEKDIINIDENIVNNIKIDYIIHTASPSRSDLFLSKPLNVIYPNVLSTKILLDIAKNNNVESFLLFSTCDIYGKVYNGYFSENIYGSIDPLDLRSVYGESKRMAETLCKAYYSQYNVPIKIARIAHTYGPTMDIYSDTRVFSEFVKNIINDQDIVMKSDGIAKRAFCYIADATLAFFKILLDGNNGEAYNVANNNAVISIRDLANLLINLYPNKQLKLIIENQNKNYLNNKNIDSLTNLFIDTQKLESLKWKANYNVEIGFKRTIEALNNKGENMEILKLKNMFLNNEIKKLQYMEVMYDKYHHKLYEYMSYIKENKNVKEIIINEDNVIINFNILDENIKLVCNFNDKVCMPFLLFNIGNYEESEMNIILKCINENDTILDIGANIGLYTIYLNKHFKNINTYSIEPMKFTYDLLSKNIELNNIKSNIYNIGLSDKDGIEKFYFNKAETAASSMKNLREDTENTEIVECKINKLDTFIFDNNIKKIDLIKIDVEGAELLVFRGGVESLKKYKPIIFSEMLRKWSKKFDYHPNDIINVLNEIGYSCFAINNNGIQKISNINDDTQETNFIFFDENKHEKIIKNIEQSRAEQSRAEQIICKENIYTNNNNIIIITNKLQPMLQYKIAA